MTYKVLLMKNILKQTKFKVFSFLKLQTYFRNVI